MKRDMDLVRLILFAFEDRNEVTMVRSTEINVEGYEQFAVMYHVNLMCEAGLLSCERVVSKSSPDRLVDAHPFRLTWQGHEFLDAARSDSLWAKAKATLAERGVPVAFGVLQATLVGLAKKQMGLD